MKNRVIFLIVLCLLVFASCGQEEMFTKPNHSNTAFDWGVTMVAMDITSTSCTLKVTQTGGNPTGEVFCGSDFWIERETDGEWISLGNDFSWTAEGYILSDQTQIFTLNWQQMYGTLAAGTYRIGKGILDLRAPGNYDQQNHYTESFTIAP